MVDHRPHFAARAPHPIGQNRALNLHAVSCHELGLPIERHVFGMLGDDNLSQKGLGRPASLQQMRRRSGLDDARSTLGAGVFWANRNGHLVACWYPVEPSVRSSLIRTMSPQPQGQDLLLGSITRSTRGRCSGSARALRSLSRTALSGSDALTGFTPETALCCRPGNFGCQTSSVRIACNDSKNCNERACATSSTLDAPPVCPRKVDQPPDD